MTASVSRLCFWWSLAALAFGALVLVVLVAALVVDYRSHRDDT